MKGSSVLKTYLLLIKNKPLPFEKKDGVTQGLKGDKLTQWISRNANKSPIIAQIRNQAKFIFSKSSQKKIYSILTFGEYWCYTFFEKETTSGFYPPNQMSASMDPGSTILWGDIHKLGTPESDQMLSRLMTTSANESGWYVPHLLLFNTLQKLTCNFAIAGTRIRTRSESPRTCVSDHPP